MKTLNENKIKLIFGFQHFSGNTRLSRLIADTESRWGMNVGQELSDDMLDVFAAGDSNAMKNQDEDISLKSSSITSKGGNTTGGGLI